MKIMLSVLHRFIKIGTNSKYLCKSDSFQKSCRHLFTQESLKINSFKESCITIRNTIPDPVTFKEEMRVKCDKDENHLIFVENLRKMIAISRDEDDLALLGQMFKKYSNQCKLVRFGGFKLGPELMRLYYTMNKPKEALELIMDSQESGNFTEISSYTILADLLFRNKMYEDVISLVNMFFNMQFINTKYPSSLVTIYFASCHQLNSPESMEKGLALWKKLMSAEYKSPLRGIWFLSMLAFKQKQPDLTLEIITPPRTTPVGNNIKLLALSEKQMFIEVVNLIKEEFLRDIPQLTNNNFITSDTLKYVENTFEAAPEMQRRLFNRLKEDMLAHSFIKEETLETFLLQDIDLDQNKKLRQFRKFQDRRRNVNHIL